MVLLGGRGIRVGSDGMEGRVEREEWGRGRGRTREKMLPVCELCMVLVLSFIAAELLMLSNDAQLGQCPTTGHLPGCYLLPTERYLGW